MQCKQLLQVPSRNSGPFCDLTQGKIRLRQVSIDDGFYALEMGRLDLRHLTIEGVMFLVQSGRQQLNQCILYRNQLRNI